MSGRPRRRRGTGTIMRTATGYRARMPGAGAWLDEWPTYEEAEQQLEDALAEVCRYQARPVGGTTLASFGAEWLDKKELSGERSANEKRSRWQQHIATALFADWPLKAITRRDILDWLDAMALKKVARGHCHQTQNDRTISRSSVQNTLNVLRCCLDEAMRRGLIGENPAFGVQLRRGRGGTTHDPWTYLLPAEQELLLTCTEHPTTGSRTRQIPETDRLAVQFALGTGLRRGEQWALELADVHMRRGTIVVRFGGYGLPPKNGKIRRIPILPLARTALELQLEWLAQQRLDRGKLFNPHRLVWPTENGVRRDINKPIRWWDEILLAAEVHPPELRHDGRAVRWHDLRHTSASSLVAGWWGRRWSLQEVKELLGHGTIQITERYAHLAESVLTRAAREMYQAVERRQKERKDERQ